MHEFFRHVGRSHETIHEAEIEERWSEGRPHAEPPGIEYERFRSTSAYDNFHKTAELELTTYRDRANAEAEQLRYFRGAELQKKPQLVVGEFAGVSQPMVDFISRLRRGGAGDAGQALADEAQAIADKAAGKTPLLGDDVLAYIAGERAVVQRRSMYLKKHLDVLTTAAINEINVTLGREHGDTVSAQADEVFDEMSKVSETLRDWYAELDRVDFPGKPDELYHRATDVVSTLESLENKAKDMAWRLRNLNPANAEPEAPLLKGGLALQAALMAREIGEQLAARLANPTFSAVFRIASERPVSGLGQAEKDLVNEMRLNPDIAPGKWSHLATLQITAALKHNLNPGMADAIRKPIDDVANAFDVWTKALSNAPKAGPGEIRNIAGKVMQRLRMLEGLVVDSKFPEPYATKLSALADAAAAYIRTDASNAKRFLEG
jgi:hypothetical protein